MLSVAEASRVLQLIQLIEFTKAREMLRLRSA